jgi:hypothetical protein
MLVPSIDDGPTIIYKLLHERLAKRNNVLARLTAIESSVQLDEVI